MFKEEKAIPEVLTPRAPCGKLDPKFKAKVLVALRDPDNQHHQLTRRLCDRRGNYCALGFIGRVGGLHDSELRGRGVVNLLRTQGIAPYQINEIVSLNDIRGYSLAQIADYIEANW